MFSSAKKAAVESYSQSLLEKLVIGTSVALKEQGMASNSRITPLSGVVDLLFRLNYMNILIISVFSNESISIYWLI